MPKAELKKKVPAPHKAVGQADLAAATIDMDWIPRAIEQLKETGYRPSEVQNPSYAAKADWASLQTNRATKELSKIADKLQKVDLAKAPPEEATGIVNACGLKLTEQGAHWLREMFKELKSACKGRQFVNTEDLKGYLTVALFYSQKL